MTLQPEVTINDRVNPPDDSSESPYRAPQASLLPEGESGVISEAALHSLVSTKWWMRMAALALIVNGAGVAAGTLYTLVATNGPVMVKLIMILALLAAGLIFMPGLRLMQSSFAVGRAAQSRSERDIVRALSRHEEFWKWLGITSLLLGALLFYVFVFVIR